jgi:hypothetical protein
MVPISNIVYTQLFMPQKEFVIEASLLGHIEEAKKKSFFLLDKHSNVKI